MKSVPNLISYFHDFFWNFSHFLAIYFELFSSGSKFNSENADEWGPPVSRRFLRRARPSAHRRHVAATRPRRSRTLWPLSGPRAGVPTATSRSRLTSCAPTAPSPTASPHARAAVVRSRPRVSERADAAIYTVRAPVSAPAPLHFSRLPSALILSTLVLVGHCRSPPNRRAARRRRPCLAMSLDATVYARSCAAPPSTRR
jgi:hypothetical protein